MCIIVVKPAGIEMPDSDTLWRCWVGNSDGAGFMYTLPGKEKVRIRKGYMSWVAFRDALRDCPDDLNKVPVVIHFRIGTQGYNDPANCHPFPVSEDHKALISRNSISDVAVAHNGIISLTSVSSTHAKEKYSDTYYFVRDYMTLIVGNDKEYYKDENKLLLLERLCDSKLAILSGNSEVKLVGKFYEESGCYFSNLSYLCSPYCYSSGKTSHTNNTNYWRKWENHEDDGDFRLNSSRIPSAKDMPYFKQIQAAFVPERYMIQDDTTGYLTFAAEEPYVYDRGGNVYLYDVEANVLVYMRGLTVVDDDLVEHFATTEECTLFNLSDDDWEERAKDILGGLLGGVEGTDE